MDVINKQEWVEVGYLWDYSYMEDYYAFKYFVNGIVVDSSFYAVLSNIYRESSIYPNQVLFAASEVHDAITNMYRGFIYSIDAWNGYRNDRDASGP